MFSLIDDSRDLNNIHSSNWEFFNDDKYYPQIKEEHEEVYDENEDYKINIKIFFSFIFTGISLYLLN